MSLYETGGAGALRRNSVPSFLLERHLGFVGVRPLIMAFQLREIFVDGNKFKRLRGHGAALKFGSTLMPNSLSSHSGMKTRFLFCSHQARSSADEVYISGVSRSCLTRSSNSVARTGAGGLGRPQLGLPRLRVVVGGATGIAIGPDHTPPCDSAGESADGRAGLRSLGCF